MPATRLWSTYEAKPAGTDNVNQGDDEIRATKVDIRERMAIDHEWNVSVAADGRHTKLTLKEVAAPTEIANYMMVYGKEADSKCELHVKDEDGDEIQITKGGDLNGEALGAAASAVFTATMVAAALAAVQANLYPVGALYTSTLTTNPGTLLGFGTWVAFGAGRVMVGHDSADADFDVAEEEGGAKTHTNAAGSLVIDKDQACGNQVWGTVGRPAASYNSGDMSAPQIAADLVVSGTSGDGSSVQPYIVVYMWKRTV